MKSAKRLTLAITLGLVTLFSASAQFSTGLDIYSSYIWRGAKFGNGPALQPYVEFAFGDFAVGAWGSVCASDNEGFEMDLYASYSIGDFSLTVTDYYFGGSFLDYSAAGGFHFIEPMVSYSLGDLSLTAAYMLAPGFKAGDTYVEAAYSFGDFDLTVGAGDGAYTSDGSFMLCNIGIGTSKEIKITDDFSLPVSGAVILNPSTEGFFITAGVSF